MEEKRGGSGEGRKEERRWSEEEHGMASRVRENEDIEGLERGEGKREVIERRGGEKRKEAEGEGEKGELRGGLR